LSRQKARIRALLFLVSCVLISFEPCQGAETYVNYTRTDSLRLQELTVGSFVWRGQLEASYRLLSPNFGTPKATLVLLHGAGDNIDNFLKIAARIESTEMNHLVIQAPFEATVHMEDPVTGQLSLFRGYNWISSTGLWPDHGVGLSLFLINKVMEEVRPSGSDGSPPLFLLGFRQAAGVAALWAARNAENVAGLILVSGYAEPPVRGYLRNERATLGGVPCLVLMGSQADDFVDAGALAVSVRELGADLTLKQLDRAAAFAAEDYTLIREFIMSHITRMQPE
jgi:predicted esterase